MKAIIACAALALMLTTAQAKTIPGSCHQGTCLDDAVGYLPKPPESPEDMQSDIDYLRAAHNFDSTRIQSLEYMVGQLQQDLKALKARK